MDGNLFSQFERAFAAAPRRPALVDPERGVLQTYGDLLDGAARYANALRGLGVEPGCRVTAQVEKSVVAVLLHLGTLKAGAVFHPLNPAYTPSEVEDLVADAEPTLLLAESSKEEALPRIASRHRAGFATRPALEAAARRSSAEHATVARDGDDLAGLLYTSGTTGRSKGAMITHRNLASNALALIDAWRLAPDDVLLHALPLFHVHGLYVALNTAFLNAAEILWLERFDAAAVSRHLGRATVFMGVPTFYARLLSDASFARRGLGRMRLFVSGSAPLSPETHRAFRERTGHAILERYGMTETGMITSNPLAGERIAGTVGFPLQDVEVRIADPQGREAARGEPGVIEVRGPNVFKGYWRKPGRTAEEMRPDGYFITGDLGAMDGEGRVTILGRSRDLIISGGLNVYPREIEAALDELPGIRESAVIGVPHADFGEGVVAAVVATGHVDEKEVIGALAGRLAGFKLPKRVFVLPDLPRNAMGKVEKAKLRAMFSATFA